MLDNSFELKQDTTFYLISKISLSLSLKYHLFMQVRQMMAKMEAALTLKAGEQKGEASLALAQDIALV